MWTLWILLRKSQQRIAVVKKFEKKIQEQAKEKYEATVGRPSRENRSPNGEQLNTKIHTDKELAKIAGVELLHN